MNINAVCSSFSLPFSCYFRPLQCEARNKISPKLCPVGKVLFVVIHPICICTFKLQWNINWVTTNVFYMWKYSNMLSVPQVPQPLFCRLGTLCLCFLQIYHISVPAKRRLHFFTLSQQCARCLFKVSWPWI